MAQKEQTILVVGGAGYIGSHMVKMLLGRGYRVVTLDDDQIADELRDG